MSAAVYGERFVPILTSLKQLPLRADDARNARAIQLKEAIMATMSEIRPEVASKIWSDYINPKLFEMTQSLNPSEKLGGLCAIDHILEIESDDAGETREALKHFRLYQYVKNGLVTADWSLISRAAQTLGKIIKYGGNFGDSFMPAEVPRLLDDVTSGGELARYASTLNLRVLAQNSATHFSPYVIPVLDRIWTPLRDSKVNTREAAAELLASCLIIVGSRSMQLHASVYERIVHEILHGFKHTSVDFIHGSLLAYREMLHHAGMFMADSFISNAEIVLRFKDHKDPIIKRTVVSLLSVLARYDNQAFSERFLHKVMAYLLPLLKKPSERTITFKAIGYIALSVRSEIKTFLEPIMANVKEVLLLRGKKGAATLLEEDAVFECIGLLAAAVGPNLTKLLHDQLDLMLRNGLSEALTSALKMVVEYIPPLLKTIQERLLETVSITLSGQHYRPIGALNPPSVVRHDYSVATRDFGSPQNTATATLALNVLATFDFNGHLLSEFVRSCVLPYLEDDSPEVRKAAAHACCHLFVRDPIIFQTSNHALEVMGEVLDKLLTAGVADPDPSIRATVLMNLEERFDRHLAQAENVRSLFTALNDEDYRNRVRAIVIIGRLTKHNPAYVMPSLRKALIQLLTELEYSTVPRSREESAKLLTRMVSAAESLIKPYTIPMLKVLLPKAEDPNPAIATSVLSCIGELARVGGEDLVPHLPTIMRIIMRTMQDQSSVPRRDAAIRTLGQVSSNTSYVIDPLKDYPQLLSMLTRILRSEQNQQMRRDTIKVIGILGALDPYQSKAKIPDDMVNEPSRGTSVTDVAVALSTSGSSSDEYYQAVVISSLLNVLKDSSLHNHHNAAIEAIMNIFRTQGLKSVAFLPQIIPAFLTAIRTPSTRSQEQNISQLAVLVWIVKQHIRNFLPEIFALISELWASSPNTEIHIVALVESIARALNAEFKPYIPMVLPPMLKLFDGENTDRTQLTQSKVFHALFAFGANIEEYLHLIIPVIMKVVESDSAISLRITAVQTIDGLSKKVNFSEHASRIIHPLVRILSHPNTPPELSSAIMETLWVLLVQLGADFAIFIPMINKCLLHNTRINHSKYDAMVTRLLSGERLHQDTNSSDPWSQKVELVVPADQGKMLVNQQHLKQAWDTSQVNSKDDWYDWARRLAIELMKESPSHAIRACVSLADAHIPLARELFNAAFVSCWPELFEEYKDDLVRSIEQALTSHNTPSDVIHLLLSLAEFLERDDKALLIDIRTLGDCAMNYHAFAKALHYKELEFWSESSPSIIESLININTKLQLHDAAFGTLTLARDQQDVYRHEEWYEKLGKWQEALVAYDRKLDEHEATPEVLIGRMRCLHALGEWDQLSEAVADRWVNSTNEEKRQIAPLAAAAAWSLNQWDQMDEYIAVMKADSPDRSFYRAILSVHRNQFSKALLQINKARDLLDGELTALVGESYGRAYNVVVRVQMLSELEEIISYKRNADQPDRQATMRKTWMKRLKGCQPDVEVWQRILQVRTLVLSPDEDTTMWIKFANLCRKSDRMVLAEKTLNSLLGPIGEEERSIRAPPPVIYAHLKFMWARGDREKSLTWLRTFSSRLADDLGLHLGETQRAAPLGSLAKMSEYTNLLARCYLKQGEWQYSMEETWRHNNIKEILEVYRMATQFDPNWYKAWHAWALANFEVIGFLENDARMDEVAPKNLIFHVTSAISGFFRSIALKGDNSLQDTLRLLTLWFKFGAHDEVYHALAENFGTVPVDTWLEVVPQIIARIQTPSQNVRRLINQLLNDVGKAHPQALIYPLTVASKSSSTARQAAATATMDRMRDHCPVLVDQALLVSHELIRVAILWQELWHEGLEEASRLYFNDKNPEGMIAVLEPLHEKLEAGPETTRETSFVQAFGKNLHEAREACRRFLMFGDINEINKAWEIYYGVFKKVEKQLPMLTTLDLQYVSPELLRARNLELAVPGTYHSGRQTVTIANFAPSLAVITSKQRPRRLSIKGSDGRDYQYVLKGHEDLRQDERVMQLFGLVNTLLSVDTESFKRHLHIQRYPVIPLAPNAGLLGWVQDSDTLHILVKEYRDSRKILLNIEYRLMLQMAPDYEILTVMQKVEVFDYALDNTTGQDLYRVLWLKSANSDAWLDRRSTYTRSLAVTSMVGYILGLGDRHPSNLLLHRVTGKVVHVDFGDCFEVAMNRDKFPEKVPFRLTRMLTHAMEVSGIQGSYRNTCEITMRVLRDNKDSLMAVLEAFVYDPLINWRLMQAEDARHAPAVESQMPKTSYAQGPNRKVKADEKEIFNEGTGEVGTKLEVRNDRALAVYNRVQNKLNGRDFNPDAVLPVSNQVGKLIEQAMSLENLCQCFHGWCAFW